MQLGRLILPILKAGGSGWDDLYDILIMINSIAEYKNVEPEFILPQGGNVGRKFRWI